MAVPKPAIPALAGLFAGVLFLAANIAALHNPQPHAAPIAVAGDAPAVQHALDAGSPGAFAVFHDAEPEQAVRERRAYAGVEQDRTIDYASANGRAAGQNLAQQLSITLHGEAEDVIAPAPEDPNVTSLQ